MFTDESRKSRLMLACAVGALTFSVALPAMAQDSTIEEVVVTARKREENLQTVPVAVSVQTGQALEKQSIRQPTDLTRSVPSLHIVNGSSSANSAVIILRGQSASDTLIGISQPIGLYEDGVNIPHPFGANNAFVDLQRVEVLKGPQGTLYGRNTTGGAINIITKDADYDGVHGFIEGEAGNFQDWKVTAAVNVPIISDVLAARVAVMHWNREGFGKSSVTGQRFGDDKDDHLARLSLRFDPTSNFSAKLKAEYTETRHNGPMLQNISISPIAALTNNGYLATALWANPAANRPLVRDALTPGSPTQAASLAQAIAIGKPLLDACIGGDPYVNCVGTPNLFDNLKTWHFVLDMNWDITDNIRLRSITGGHHFRNDKNGDLDAVQAQLLEIGYGIGGSLIAPNGGELFLPTGRGLELKPDQASTQWSQEFNLSGDLLDKRLNWLLGAFASQDLGHGAQINAFQPELPAVRGLDIGLGSHDNLNADNRTWAVFTQNDFKVTDQLSVTLGARYTVERLHSDLSDWFYNFNTGVISCRGATVTASGGVLAQFFPAPDQNNADSCAFGGLLTTGPDNVFSRRKFTGWSYLASVNYQITPDKLVYAKTAKGFRGGAFSRSIDLMAEPEIAKDYEVGFKGDWLDRRLRTNVALFLTDYTNKQVSIQVCSTTGLPPVNGSCPLGTGFSTIIRNAAAARLKGIEGEFTFKPIDRLTINASASAIKAYYTKWAGAVSGEGAPIADAKGVPISNGAYSTPNWQGDINARYDIDVGSGVMGFTLDYALRGRIPVTLVTNQAQVPDALEYKINSAVGLLNARIDYTIADKGLQFAVFATNLTDKVWGYEGISANYTAGVGHRVMSAPRMWGVSVRKSFGE
jgi:iron complex outermembrane receptor protein